MVKVSADLRQNNKKQLLQFKMGDFVKFWSNFFVKNQYFRHKGGFLSFQQFIVKSEILRSLPIQC